MLPGAAGETEKQMAAVLPGDGKIRRDWTFLSGDFSRSLRCYSANRIFADRSVELKDAYKKAVGPNTGNRIRNLLNPQRMSDRTVLVLVNAMYLRAFWDSKFEGRDTALRTFVREDGAACQVPMMKQQVFTEGRSWPRQGGMYYEKDGVRGASLFFTGGKGAPVFMAVLPPEGRKMKQFIDGMTAEDWNGILSSLSARDAAEETRKPGGKPPRGRGPEIEFNRPFLWLIYSPEDRAVLFMGTYEGPECGKKEGKP